MNESTSVPREKLNDLDWLARNVHEWPAGEHQPWGYVYMAHGEVMKAAGNFLDAVAKPTVITIDQWLARRAELQNKPSWNDAPEWATHLGQNKRGQWYFMQDGQVVDCTHRYHMHKKCSGEICVGEVLGDWRDTLEKRPADLSEQAVTVRLKNATDNVLAAVPELMTDKYKFTPFTSIEDNQEKGMTKQQEMKQDNGWFERGDLPPVGIEIEAWFDDGRECWHKANVIGYSLQEERVLAVSLKGTHDRKLVWVHHFRPIRAERDALVEVLTKVKAQGVDIIGVADAILAEGFSLEAK